MLKTFILTSIFSYHICCGQDVDIIKLPQLQNLINGSAGKIHVINFWATWCGPCLKELPYFEKINSEGRPDVEVTLVSLDLDLDPDPQKVRRFVKLKKLQSRVVMLDETNPDSWIDKIEQEWSGALPATIIINQKTGKRIFIGRAVRHGELEQHLNEIQ